jgi:hypothetical protein
MKHYHQQLDHAFTDFWLRMELGPSDPPLTRMYLEHIACEYYIAFSFAFDKADRQILDELLTQKKPPPEEFLPLLPLLMDGIKRRGGPLPQFSTAERRNIFFLMMQEKVQTKKTLEVLAEEFAEQIRLNTKKILKDKSIRNIWDEFKDESWAIEFIANNNNSS